MLSFFQKKVSPIIEVVNTGRPATLGQNLATIYAMGKSNAGLPGATNAKLHAFMEQVVMMRQELEPQLVRSAYREGAKAGGAFKSVGGARKNKSRKLRRRKSRVTRSRK